MAARLAIVDRDTPMLLPTDLRDWLPDDHMVHFIIDAVETLDLQGFRINDRGSGSEQFPPAMMLALLVYCYATGRFSSREIEAATYSDVAVRYVCGSCHHPDHSVICAFRTQNRKLFSECFVKVLALAQHMGKLAKVGAISIDGTKIKANASKHAAVSYKRAGEMIQKLELEVEQLIKKAEAADSTPLDDGLSLPDEISRREDRKARLEAARKMIESQFEPKRKEKEAEYRAKMEDRERRKRDGKPPRGREPKPPPSKPDAKAQVNFTDPDSRIMKAGNGKHYEQAYNAQAAVDADGSYLIVGERVSANPNDKQELQPDVESVDPAIRQPTDVLADTGYFSEEAIEAVETDDGPTTYVAVERGSHHVTVEDLEKKSDPPPPESGASVKDRMRHRLQTKEGKEKYRLRKQTVEPVFGIVKEVMGFRQFHLRGHPKVQIEWTLVCLAYNMKRLFNMAGRTAMPKIGWMRAYDI